MHAKLAMILVLVGTPAAAIVIRHDRPDQAYLVDAKEFPSVAHVLGQTEGTLIARQWVLTVAHTLESLDPFSNWRVIIAGQSRPIAKIIMHPKREPGAVDSDFDLALLKLEQPVTDVAPTALYAGRDEPDQIATLVGRGGTRTGLPGSGDYVRDHRMRRATNKIQAVFEHSLIFTFDDVRDGTDLEGISGPNDSGGPAFVTKDGVRYLAGVASFSAPNAERGAYGTLDAYARVSSHRAWIQQVMAADPPSTVAKWSEERRVTGRAEWPATPVGQLASRFFAAYGPDAGRLARFMRTHGSSADAAAPDKGAAPWLDRYRTDGALTVHSFRTLGDRDIAVRAFAPRTGKWYGFWLTSDLRDPTRLAGILSGGLPPPG